jgi:hypothetical protein
VSSPRELAEHIARRLHTLLMHRSPFERCEDWECKGNREALERLVDERREGAA